MQREVVVVEKALMFNRMKIEKKGNEHGKLTPFILITLEDISTTGSMIIYRNELVINCCKLSASLGNFNTSFTRIMNWWHTLRILCIDIL
jgi:hypothetical protein